MHLKHLPCLCGGKPKLHQLTPKTKKHGWGKPTYFYKCGACGKQSAFRSTPTKALINWNSINKPPETAKLEL